MELIPNLQTSSVGSSIWLSSAYLPGAIVFVSRFYLTRAPIAGAGHSADESGFPARAETRNWGFGGTAGLRAISKETDRLARDTEMWGRSKTPEQNSCARSREKQSPQRAPVSRQHSASLAGQKPPGVPVAREATFGSSTSSREPGPATASTCGSQFSSSIVSAQAQEPSDGKQLRAAELPGWGDAVGILDPLAKSPTIFNERIDHFNGGSPRSWPGVGVF